MQDLPERYNLSQLLDDTLEAGRSDNVAILHGDNAVSFGALFGRVCAGWATHWRGWGCAASSSPSTMRSAATPDRRLRAAVAWRRDLRRAARDR